MITDNKPFDTNLFFSGGAGMFIQYHDVIKPVYLYAILQMIITQQTYGLPISMIEHMSIVSIIEWYCNRRYKNPLWQLDYANQLYPNELDELLQYILLHDKSIYSLCPVMNIDKMMYVYRSQHMTFPVYIYSEHEEPFIEEDCKKVFDGITVKYFFGDLKEAVLKCDQNFTYIFSDIELVKIASESLIGTCSHILLTRDYRYNYSDNFKTFKYDLKEMTTMHPFVRIGTTLAMNPKDVIDSYSQLKFKEDN